MRAAAGGRPVTLGAALTVRQGIATDRSFILSLRQARRSTPPWRAAATVLMPARPASTTGTQLAALQATTRALTRRYVLALSLIAAFAIGGFLILEATVRS